MSNPQTMEEFDRYRLELGGFCTGCKPARLVKVDNAKIIERYGPNALMRDVAARVVCSACRKPVRISVSCRDASGPPPTFG